MGTEPDESMTKTISAEPTGHGFVVVVVKGEFRP
ncbi:unnamed protein product, partial [marine sediment metagenome]